jgi:hypothetical protein
MAEEGKEKSGVGTRLRSWMVGVGSEHLSGRGRGQGRIREHQINPVGCGGSLQVAVVPL